MDNKVLVVGWCVEDGWYGKRYRAILSPSVGECFATAKEANKHKAAFRKHVNSISPQKIRATDITVADNSKLLEFEYNSFGPSMSYTHHNIIVAQLTK